MLSTVRQVGVSAVLIAAVGVWADRLPVLLLGVSWAALAGLLLYRDTTRHRRLRQAAARALEQASVEHEQQRCIFDALEQSVALTSVNGTVLLLNGAAERLLGYTAQELTDVVQSGRWEVFREDGTLVPHDERPIRRTIATGQPVRDEILVLHTRAGRPVTLRVATQPVHDVDGVLTRVVTAFSDVTAERATARELARTQARFEALVEQSTDLICLIDATGSLVYASPAAERLLGFSDVSFLGHAFTEFLHPDDVGGVLETYQRLLKSPGAVEFVETRVATAEGGWRHMEIAATNRFDDPAVRGVVANARDVTERAETAARLVWQAFHDPLTGLANRALLLDRLGNALDRSRRSARTSALMFIDLDDFKLVNDTLGHEAGDQLLIEVADRLSSLVRVGDTVARLGGDEFIILADSLESPDEAIAIARRINTLLRQPIVLGTHELSVSASIGLAFDQEHEPDRLLREADNALYRAKAMGKGRYEVFTALPPTVDQAGFNPIAGAIRVS